MDQKMDELMDTWMNEQVNELKKRNVCDYRQN